MTMLALRGLRAIALVGLMGGCSPSLLSLPFDPGGHGLNSPYEESAPKATSQYLVFGSDRSGSQDIYLYDLSTQQLIELPGLNALDTLAADPDISGDGHSIVFTGSHRGKSDIYLYDRQTRQLRNLTENLDAEVRHPSISADGRAIAFEANTSGQWDILLYNRAGQPLDIPTNPR
jgi:Tol biopolymer transport system component